jgi:hypothetical protein
MLSSVSFSACTPLGFSYPYDSNFKVEQQLLSFADGFHMYLSPLMASARDVAVNNQEFVVLSDYINLEDCIEQNKKESSLVQFSTSIFLSGVGYWKYDGASFSISPDKIDDGNVFIFRFDLDNDTVELISRDAFFLTFDETLKQFVFQEETVVNFNGVSPQRFNYILDGNSIVLFTSFSYLSAQYSLTFDTGLGVLSATRSLDSSGSYATNSIFTLGELPSDTTIDNYRYGQSNWIQYTSPTYALTIKRSVSALPGNVLVTSPYKNAVTGLDIDINGLKNFLTPDSHTNIDVNGNVNQREYYGLFTGHNQEEGYDNIYVAYQGTTQGVVFQKDKYTWFHYPNTSTTININNTTLALNGAVAGNAPNKSDKVFKKLANYKKYSNWGESLPIYEQNGMWLCTWLSGSPDPSVAPVWVDRYLNPTLTNNLSAVNDLVDLLIGTQGNDYIGTTDLSAIAINSTFIANVFNTYNQAFIDVESTFTFDPGVLYIYHHIGEQNNRTIVGQLSGETRQYYVSGDKVVYDTLPGVRQLLYINNWSATSGNDESPFDNNVTIVNSASVKAEEDLVHNSVFTRASAYGITEESINLAQNESFTLSVNVYADDWGNLYGDQIIGNYFNGGVGIFVNNRVLTPLFYMYESTQGRNIEMNSDFYMLRETKLSNTPSASAEQFIFKRDYDEEFFIIDSGKNILRYDSANILVSATALSGTITGTILDAQQDGVGNVYILATNGVYSYNTQTGELTYQFSPNNAARLVIDTHNNISVLENGFIDSAVDSHDDIFAITNSAVYHNGIMVFTAANAQKILCDVHDNVWVLHGNKVSKLTNTPTHILTTTLPTSGVASMCVGYNLIGDGVYEEYLVVVDETNKRITSLDLEGNITSTQPISALSGQLIVTPSMSFRLVRGDVNGYDYQRKYSRKKQSVEGINVKIFTKHKITNQSKVFQLAADTSKLTSGWHNIAVVFNSERGNAKLFIDGDLFDKTNEDVNTYQFNYRASNNRNEERFIIGTTPSKNGTLNEKIRQAKAYIFDGGFNEIRLFNVAFADDVVEMISRNGYVSVYDDMIWNMPVGNNQYLEEIERFFKHKLPGNKSQFFNLKIRGYKPSTTEVQELFEKNIREVITKIVPAYTQVKNIEWIE